MSLTIADNFDYKGKKPLDVRQEFATLDLMRSYPDYNLPDGFVTYCTETGVHYKFNAANEVDESTGKWRVFAGGGGAANLNDLFDVDGFDEDLPDGMYGFIKQGGIYRPVPASQMQSGNELFVQAVEPSRFEVGLGNDAFVSVLFRSTLYGTPTGPGNYVIEVNGVYHSGGTIEQQVITPFNVGSALTYGTNSVVVTVTDSYGYSMPAKFTVTAVMLSLTCPTFAWHQAFTGSNISLPCYISGTLQKVLEIKVEGITGEYEKSYSANIGTATYTETAYNYQIPHPGTEGVYRITAYIRNASDTIHTNPVTFEVICIKEGTSKLMCINNRRDGGVNWAENALFDYSLYDGGAASTAATFRVLHSGTQLFELAGASIPTLTRQTFSFPLELADVGDDSFNIDVEVKDVDGETDLTPSMTFPIAGAAGFTPMPDAVFYLNPKTRSNTQANRTTIINETNGSPIAATWSGMNWANDGWRTDSDGTRILRIMAGAKCEIDYKPFAEESARRGKTIELDFMADNVVDGTEAIISMLTPNGDSYIGYRVAPDEITMFSQSKRDGTTQHLPTDNGVRLRATMVIMPDAYGNTGFNLVYIYINGRKNRTFSYESNDYFAQQGKIIIGSDTADIDLYAVRIYDGALTADGVLRNYISLLNDTAEKEAEKAANDVFDLNGVYIDYNNVRGKLNCFIVDTPFPRYTDPASRISTLEMDFADKMWFNFITTNLTTTGQGTSSMFYFLWNVRWRNDKNPDSVTTYEDGTTDKQRIDMFPGVTPAMQRITAKKNWASSMQDHKAGAVAAFNDLGKAVGLTNVAIDANPLVRTAVYQVPAVGFSKQQNEEGEWIHTFQGEFTIGPDKGDTATFDLDKKKYPNMIAIEGADNAPLPALFRVPWNTNKSYMVYNPDSEAWEYNGAKAWSLRAGKESNIDRFIPAYNLAYQCSDRIRPFLGTLDELNAEVLNYRTTGYEYWIAKEGDANYGNLYYYEAAEGMFIPSDIGEGQINLFAQLADKGYGLVSSDIVGKTAYELNAMFIVARTRKFRAEAGEYFDIDHAVFHANFVEFYACTDNRAKNTYFVHYGTPGAKWHFNQDDLDTMNRIDNQGQDKKPYSCETHDLYASGQPVWNGETSAFWNLMELAFPEELATGMRAMLAAMEELSGMTGGTPYERVYGFYQKYFLHIKKYFPAAIVNADAKFYEDAKLAYLAGTYSNDTDPLSQSHGDFYTSETAWMKKRIVYIMSKYSYGLFSAKGTDIIVVRAAGNEITYDLTPAMDLYPTIANGTSIIRGERTKAGQPCRILVDLGGSADQQNIIQGASYLLNIGEWHNKNVSGTMTIQGRRLQEINLGHATEDIVISITNLVIANTPSVRLINLRRIATLGGVLDLSACIHLKEVYAQGTAIAQLKLPEGGGLEHVGFSAANAYLMLRNFPVLRAENVDTSLCAGIITDFYVQDCAMINPIDMLISIMEAQDGQSDHALKRVRAVGFDATYGESNGAYVLDRLAELADGSYVGLDSEGLAGESAYPVLDGKLTVKADVYEDSLIAIEERFPRLQLTVTGERYVRFIDPEVHRIVVSKWGGGKPGVTYEQLDAITDISSSSGFNTNTLITDFSDFGKNFRNVVTVRNNAFADCPNLTKFGMVTPISFTAANTGAFYRTGLDEHGIDLTKILPPTGSGMYAGMFNYSNFVNVVVPANVQYANSEGVITFYNCDKLRSIKYAEGITWIGNPLAYATGLEYIDFPSTITLIGRGGNGLFNNAKMENFKYYIIRSTTPPTYNGAISGYGRPAEFAIYVPDASVAAYKAANGWKGFTVLGLTDLPDEAREIEELLNNQENQTNQN